MESTVMIYNDIIPKWTGRIETSHQWEQLVYYCLNNCISMATRYPVAEIYITP